MKRRQDGGEVRRKGKAGEDGVGKGHSRNREQDGGIRIRK